MKTLLSVAFFLTQVFFTTYIMAAADNDMEYDGAFKTISNPTEYIANEFKLAQSEDKKVLFVLGGNWCHDSRSLAHKLDDPKLSKFVDSHYRISMIDVGFLEKAFEFTKKAQMNTFYATPTVLIFDPKTEKLVNGSDMHIWARAFSLSQQEAVDYFEKYSVDQPEQDTKNLSEMQQQQLTKLSQFISTQETRIRDSYKTLGPLLERQNADKKDEHFGTYWQALAKLRFQLPVDIKTLRETILNSSDEELKNIIFPTYQHFPWEEKSS